MRRVTFRLEAAGVALIVIALFAGIIARATPPAAADHLECNTNPITGLVTCTLVEDPTSAPGSTAPGSGSTDRCTWEGNEVPCVTDMGWWSDGCYWKAADPQPPASDAAWTGHKPGDGSIYVKFCMFDPPGPYYVWSANPPAGVPIVIPPAATIALRAEALLRLPALRAESNGSASGATYVSLPTWLWIDGSGWKSLSASASVGTRAVTVTATPVATTWDMGDGSPPVKCAGPGAPFDREHPYDPPCGYTYRTSSAHAAQTGPSPNDRYFHVQGAVVFAIHWVCSGNCDQASGDLEDMTWNTTPIALRVFEVQTVVVNH
jgi:hypothetical protein